MSSLRNPDSIRIGLVSDEPMWVAGLASIFEEPAQDRHAQFLPVIGSLAELLADRTLEYLVVDLHSSTGSLETLDAIRRARPNIRLIVIGPEGNDELVLNSIISGG